MDLLKLQPYPFSIPLSKKLSTTVNTTGNRKGAAAPLLWGGWAAPKKIITKGNGGSHRTPAFLLTHSLALAGREGREMPRERLGLVLKDAMDGKGKRLETNVRLVIAATFQAVLKGREVCIDLDIELVSKLRFIVVFS